MSKNALSHVDVVLSSTTENNVLGDGQMFVHATLIVAVFTSFPHFGVATEVLQLTVVVACGGASQRSINKRALSWHTPPKKGQHFLKRASRGRPRPCGACSTH